MTRFILQYLLPLLLPAAAFVIYVLLTRQRAGGEESVAERLRSGPWAWLIIGGFVLATVTLVTIALIDGAPPGSDYSPPRFEDGEVVPGTFE